MFFHNFSYLFKALFKNRTLIFWTFAFPIILGTFFSLAFSNIEKGEQLSIIDIAVVDNEEFQKEEAFQKTLEELGKEEGENQLFSIQYVGEEKAKELLDKEEITGYMLFSKEAPKAVVKKSGINETVLQSVLEEMVQSKQIVEDIAGTQIQTELQKGNYAIDYEKIYQNVMDKISEQETFTKDVSTNQLSYMMIEYYTLIAMTCLYGAMLGMYAINTILANMSKKGMRIQVSPMKKSKLLFSSVLASYAVQLIGVGLLFAYTILVLKVDYGTRILPVILLALTGSLAGLTFGVAVATLFKTSEDSKIGVITGGTMLGCFLSGMMGVTMKYVVDKNMPIVNQLNPANMITDGFYALYYYPTLDRFWFDIGSLAIFALLMTGISVLVLRRQKYDSI